MAALKPGQLEVTCRDEEDETQTQIFGPDDYVIITIGRVFLAHVQTFKNGTTILTLKKEPAS